MKRRSFADLWWAHGDRIGFYFTLRIKINVASYLFVFWLRIKIYIVDAGIVRICFDRMSTDKLFIVDEDMLLRVTP